jgi:hypothetical protein
MFLRLVSDTAAILSEGPRKTAFKTSPCKGVKFG